MIIMIDNGSGAQEISRMLRAKNQVLPPQKAVSAKASGYIFSDGKLDINSQKCVAEILESFEKPVMGIGIGGLYICASFGADIKEIKTTKKEERVIVKKSCPLVLDLKKSFMVVKNCQYTLDVVPENFTPSATSPKCEFEILQESEMPFFSVYFNPELGGEGKAILSNFERFVGVWDKYHK